MTALRLVGRDFDGFRAAVSVHAAGWPGTVDARWHSLRDLQDLTVGGAAMHDGSTDLVVVPADWLPALAEAGAVRSLSPMLDRAAPDGWPGCWCPSFHEGIGYAGQVWGLPFHDGPQLLFTRTDLYDDPGEQARYEEKHGLPLAPARTWAELLAQASWFARGSDLHGTVLAGAPDGHNNVYDFVVQLWLRGGDLLRGGEVVLDSPAAAEALVFLRDLATRLVTPHAHDLDSVQSGAEFAAGRVATMLNWAGFAAFGREPGSPVHGRVHCSPAPAAEDGRPTTTVNAFWAAAVTTGSAQHETAWDYLLHATSARMDRETSRAGASGARLSTWQDEGLLSACPELSLFAGAHEHSRPLWRVPQLPFVVDVLSSLVDDVVWAGAPVEPSLTVAAHDIAGLLRTPGPARAPSQRDLVDHDHQENQ